MDTTVQAPVKLTESAVNEVKKLMSEPGFDAEHRAGAQLCRHLFFDQQLVAAALDDI